MTALLAPSTLARPRLPRWAPAVVAIAALAVAGLVSLLLGWGWIALLIVAGLLYVFALPLWSRFLEGPRAATDRLMTNLVWAAFVVVCVPLLWLLIMVVQKGAPQINGHFLTTSMRGVFGSMPGGILHALQGTIVVTIAATIISVPIGLMTAIYLIEYGRGGRLARLITFLVDVMTGIPSIVAGLFALALLVMFFGPAFRAGIGGAIALALLMIPTVVRSAEEMLRLVPSDLREASYALGVPKWRTIVRVVLPTAIGGIVTGVVLAISRVIGETAPLLVTAGYNDSMNGNLFSGRMTTLPVFIFNQYKTPGATALGTHATDPPGYARAWGAALVLIVIVMILNLIARIIGKIFAPKTGR
ncbi:phosphate ABC transporter permease PstA [Nocardioides sp. BP30]|uniref:phosphate ABC transporter permease PstA n=1 Tax=Nocardioides sp. BP30 TaxID=3036374 RepID=UPI0024688943|nr:phosphate ABC transporter permease PstA [Nocardioides sp. BP30]WGL52081.1 phosphate ABC transporter permease PstA [Nocardioides sp. BP30]